MSSIINPKTFSKHSCDKCVSPGTSNISLNESDLSVRTNDTHINGSSYANTSSPSSITSASTVVRSPKSLSKSDLRSCTSSKRRYRHDKLFHYTHSLNRQYIITMTNIIFQMQKEIYKLNKRTRRVEQILIDQRQSSAPVIRIPRITTDEITMRCVKDKSQQNVAAVVSEDKETNHVDDVEPCEMIANNAIPSNEYKENTESSITVEATNQANDPQRTTHTKYCAVCDREFSHRSAYLRHMRRMHQGIFSTDSNQNNSVEFDGSHIGTPALTTDPPEIENEATNDSLQVLINQWDYGEGRLRPRRVSKASGDPANKAKCDVCNKLLRIEYLKKHKRRAHCISQASSSNESNDRSSRTASTTANAEDATSARIVESPSTNTDPPSASTNLPSTGTNPLSDVAMTEMDIDETPMQFRKESNKPIIIASTCLDHDQIKDFEEFLQKFSSRVHLSPAVDSYTTHLITNDDQHFRRSPLSMKLIEGIANHCFCLSYRWIIDCLKYDRIVDEEPYEIEGDDTQIYPHGGPKRSRSIEKRSSLFENICFMIKCTGTRDIRMTNDRLQDLIKTCGGRIITCVTQDLLNRYDIVVLCDKVYVSERRPNYDQCRSLDIHFVSYDWVLESILEYRQKPFEPYEETPYE